MNNVTFIVPRIDGDSKTIAIVTAQVRDGSKLAEENDFREALILAITEWVKKSYDGKQEWKRSSEDFNIGDLSMAQPFSHLLKKFLQKHGIFELKVETWDQTNRGYWLFDDVLVDREQVS